MSSLSPRVLVLSPRLRASSCRHPRPGPCGAAAATAAIAAASLAMWLHFVRAPAPAAPARSSSSAAAFLPPARSGPPAARPSSSPPSRDLRPGSGGASSAPRPARRRTEWRAADRPGALHRSAAPLLLPDSEAAARASNRLARSFGGAYTCVTDIAESQLLPGSAADVSDPQPLGGRIVQAE